MNITDLLAPNAKTIVIISVMPKAIKSGGLPDKGEVKQLGLISLILTNSENLPNIVPTVSPMVDDIAPPVNESKLELNAHAQALVPKI